jgi:uncharacterized glyoxalase superfamily protein PhnB
VPGWGVIPSIRVLDLAEALAFYTRRLEFTLDSGGEDAAHASLTRGDGHVMIETAAADFYGDQYNEAIRQRVAMPSSVALYIEAEDLVAFHSRLKAGGTVRIIDPLASRPWGQEEFTVEDHAGNWLTFWRKPDPAA